ncbi:hypothetical protein Trydic_g7829 [Trypoxylus dichotomus]
METSDVEFFNMSRVDMTKEDLQLQYSSLSKICRQLRIELEEKSQQVYDHKRELTRLNTLEAEYLSEIECLQSGEKNECKRLQLKIQNLEEEKTEVTNTYTKEIECLELNIFKKDEEIAELQEKLQTMTNTFNATDNRNEIEEVQLKNIELKNNVHDLNELLLHLNKRIESLEKKHVVSQELNQNLQDELKALNENYKCKKGELDEAKHLIETLQEDLILTKNELEIAKTKPLEDGSQGNSLFAEVDNRRLELQEHMALMKSQYLQMKQERGKLLAQIATLNSSNAMLCQRWEIECKESVEDQDRLEEAYRARIKFLETELNECREEIATRQEIPSNNLDSEGMKYLENVLDSKNEEIAKLQKELDRFSLSHMVLSRQLKDSNVDLRNWRAKATKLESQVGKLRAEIEDIKLKQNSEAVIGDRRTIVICPSCIRNKKSMAPVAPSSQIKLKDVVKNLCRNSEVSICDDRFRSVDCSRQLKRSLLKETELGAKNPTSVLEDAKENIENVRESELPNDDLTKKVQFTEETLDNSDKSRDRSDSDSDENMSETNEEISDEEQQNTTLEVDENSDNEENHDEEEEEDSVIKAIREASSKKRDHPPVIECESFVVDICFHPGEDLLAIANIDGDVLLYKYANEENTLLQAIELHEKACRAIDFSTNGDTLFSVSKDKAIMLTGVETCKLKRFYDNSHDVPVYTISILNENLFSTGDDSGGVKLWDLRVNDDKSIFSLKKNEDYISKILTHSDEKYLFCSSGDGSLTTIDLKARKFFMQSEEYEEELTSLGLFRDETKLLASSSKGNLFLYNWNEFGLHSDMFPGTKTAINAIVPITENIVVTACEDGILRASHLFPHRHLGIVGRHALSIECVDICNNGIFLASSSHDNDVRFWNIQYFEDFEKVDKKYNKHKKKMDMRTNLPSSQRRNNAEFFSDLC